MDVVEYDHSKNLHTRVGAKSALKCLFESGLIGRSVPKSLLDVGCGRGTWIAAARELEVSDVFGLDGVDIAEQELLFPSECFRQVNLEGEWDLERAFELVTCLEVAEHLSAEAARQLISRLIRHSDTIVFSAASPGQSGQHHINCQWPEYWQALFNENGFICDDTFRWKIWDAKDIEAWYRQNIFIAQREPGEAGKEPRIKAVVHPDMMMNRCFDIFNTVRSENTAELEEGRRPSLCYLKLAASAFSAKLKHRFG